MRRPPLHHAPVSDADTNSTKKGRQIREEGPYQAVREAVARFGRFGRLRGQGHISSETIHKAAQVAGLPEHEIDTDSKVVEQWLTSEGCDAYFAINDDIVRTMIASLIKPEQPVDAPSLNSLALAAMAVLGQPSYEDPKGFYTKLKAGMLAHRIRTARAKVVDQLPGLLVAAEHRPEWLTDDDLQPLWGRLRIAGAALHSSTPAKATCSAKIENRRRFVAQLRQTGADALRLAVGVCQVRRHEDLLKHPPKGLRTELRKRAPEALKEVSQAAQLGVKLCAAAEIGGT